MKKKEENEDPNKIKKLLAQMDFEKKVKIAQEEREKNRKNKDSDK
jgi:hypothetical protein